MRWLFLVISVLFVLTAAAIGDPDVPLDDTKPPTPAPEAAKRYYAPPSVAQIAAEMRKEAAEQYKQCLNDWDAATHMTKKEWQRTCRRVVDNRAKFRLEMSK